MNKIHVAIGAVLGVLFVALAFMYWFTPAGSLPTFMPGYLAGSTATHLKHGIAALALGIGAFIYAWFMSGKRQPPAA